MAQRPESKFYQKLKQELPELILTRLENWAVLERQIYWLITKIINFARLN
jgi:hypothetical protein